MVAHIEDYDTPVNAVPAEVMEDEAQSAHGHHRGTCRTELSLLMTGRLLTVLLAHLCASMSSCCSRSGERLTTLRWHWEMDKQSHTALSALVRWHWQPH